MSPVAMVSDIGALNDGGAMAQKEHGSWNAQWRRAAPPNWTTTLNLWNKREKKVNIVRTVRVIWHNINSSNLEVHFLSSSPSSTTQLLYDLGQVT